MDELTRTSVPSIRMGELRVGRDGSLMRTLLGSCVGLALYDRRQKIGGLAHIVLPASRGKSDRPGKFVDTAVPEMIEQLEKLAGKNIRLSAKLAGGASMFSAASTANIGEMNIQTCEDLLREMRIPILAKHCGGKKGRRMTLNTETGNVLIEIVGQDQIELQ